jgi:hypothetical protein
MDNHGHSRVLDAWRPAAASRLVRPVTASPIFQAGTLPLTQPWPQRQPTSSYLPPQSHSQMEPDLPLNLEQSCGGLNPSIWAGRRRLPSPRPRVGS